MSLRAGHFSANPWPFTAAPPLPLRGRPRWHTRFNTYDIPRVMALYAEHASLESPAILAIYPHLKDGILRGRSEIGKFFSKTLSALSKEFRELYRSDLFLSTGKLLTPNTNIYELGAASEKVSDEGKPYFSVKLDGPTLQVPIQCALIERVPGFRIAVKPNRPPANADRRKTRVACCEGRDGSKTRCR